MWQCRWSTAPWEVSGWGIVVELIGSEKQTNLGAVRWWRDVGWILFFGGVWVSEAGGNQNFLSSSSFFFGWTSNYQVIQSAQTSSPSWRSRTTPWKGHLTIPKRSLWITRYLNIRPLFLFRGGWFRRDGPSPAMIDWFWWAFVSMVRLMIFKNKTMSVQSFGKNYSLVLPGTPNNHL